MSQIYSRFLKFRVIFTSNWLFSLADSSLVTIFALQKRILEGNGIVPFFFSQKS
jgi:hypothetical protein